MLIKLLLAARRALRLVASVPYHLPASLPPRVRRVSVVVGIAPLVVLLGVNAKPADLDGSVAERSSHARAFLDPGERGRGGPSRPAGLARVAGITLAVPAAEYLLIGFHEANGMGTTTLEPLGKLQANDHSAAAPPPHGKGEPYRILAQRGRGTHPTSAVDVALRAGQDVVAVVDGTVVQAGAYSLYGGFEDELVVIAPKNRPGVLVKMLHVEGVRVRPGDDVKAGRTVVADTARVLPFPSQVDRLTGGRHPHVHIEVIRG